MWKPEWDVSDKMRQMQARTDEFDHRSEVCCISEREMRIWESFMQKITAWVNLKEGLPA